MRNGSPSRVARIALRQDEFDAATFAAGILGITVPEFFAAAARRHLDAVDAHVRDLEYLKRTGVMSAKLFRQRNCIDEPT